jgi:Smg protein
VKVEIAEAEIMKESVLDVLKFLFETSFDADCNLPISSIPDRDALKAELEGAGFHATQVEGALGWLDGLAADGQRAMAAPAPRAIRVFDSRECERLDTECRGYILYLESVGILDAARRELVLDRLLALDGDSIELEQVKWIVLLVLFSQPEQELSLLRMEGLMFEQPVHDVH